MQILIFRTSISTRSDLKRLRELLSRYPQVEKWNVDLEDWEKILRIECNGLTAGELIVAPPNSYNRKNYRNFENYK